MRSANSICSQRRRFPASRTGAENYENGEGHFLVQWLLISSQLGTLNPVHVDELLSPLSSLSLLRHRTHVIPGLRVQPAETFFGRFTIIFFRLLRFSCRCEGILRTANAVIISAEKGP